MKPPHQVNLILWVDEGKDEELVEDFTRTLEACKARGIIHTEVDGDPTWYWHGLKGVDDAPRRNRPSVH